MAETEGEKREAEGGSKTPPPPQMPKTVKFCGAAEVRSAPQETPLMFSRASSVASLDSFDHEGSLHDGYYAMKPLEQPLVVSHPPTCPTLQAKQCQHLLDREDLGLLQGRAKPQVCPHWPPPTRSPCTRTW